MAILEEHGMDLREEHGAPRARSAPLSCASLTTGARDAATAAAGQAASGRSRTRWSCTEACST
eukprot:scaffold546_cov352-Prasinococcus_capsulatus_cf.AAC.4